MHCAECGKDHAELTKCEGCGRCLYKNVKKQIPNDLICIVECKCGKRQIWD